MTRQFNLRSGTCRSVCKDSGKADKFKQRRYNLRDPVPSRMMKCCSEVLNRIKARTCKSSEPLKTELHFEVTTIMNEESRAVGNGDLEQACSERQECVEVVVKPRANPGLSKSDTSGQVTPSRVQPGSKSQPFQDYSQARPQPKVGTGWPPYKLMPQLSSGSPVTVDSVGKVMAKGLMVGASWDTEQVTYEDHGRDLVLVQSTTSSSAPSEAGVDYGNSVPFRASNASNEDVGPTAWRDKEETASASIHDGVAEHAPLAATPHDGLAAPKVQQKKDEDAPISEVEAAHAESSRDNEDRKLCRFIKNRNRRMARKRRRIAFLDAVKRTASEVASAVLTAAVSAAPGNQEMVQAVVEAAKAAVAKAEEAAKTMPVSFKDYTPARESACAIPNRSSTVNPWLTVSEIKAGQGLSDNIAGVGLCWPSRSHSQPRTEPACTTTAEQLRRGFADQQDSTADLGLRNLSRFTVAPVPESGHHVRYDHQRWPLGVGDRRSLLSSASQELYGHEKGQEVLRPIPWTPSKWQPWE